MTESRLVLGLLAGLGVACGSEDDAGCTDGSPSVAVTTGVSDPVPVPGSACDAVVTAERESIGYHVRSCSRVEYSTNPPSSGSHYPSWAAYRVYDEPVPRGYWVHSLEHGAVVIAYRCRDCAADVANARALVDGLPEDPACLGTSAARRVILTPDPLLDVPWAAAAWGFTLRSECFEPEVFRAFAEEYYDRAPEHSCLAGREF